MSLRGHTAKLKYYPDGQSNKCFVKLSLLSIQPLKYAVSVPSAASFGTSKGYFEELSEDELHGPSLYSIVRLGNFNPSKKSGYAARSRVLSRCTPTYNSVNWACIYARIILPIGKQQR